LYNNYDCEFWEHGRWLDQQVILSKSNIIHSFKCVYKKREGGEWNPKNIQLPGKLQKVQDFVVRFSNNKTKLVQWHMQTLKATM
jgi:hypothetical protein